MNIAPFIYDLRLRILKRNPWHCVYMVYAIFLFKMPYCTVKYNRHASFAVAQNFLWTVCVFASSSLISLYLDDDIVRLSTICLVSWFFFLHSIHSLLQNSLGETCKHRKQINWSNVARTHTHTLHTKQLDTKQNEKRIKAFATLKTAITYWIGLVKSLVGYVVTVVAHCEEKEIKTRNNKMWRQCDDRWNAIIIIKWIKWIVRERFDPIMRLHCIC